MSGKCTRIDDLEIHQSNVTIPVEGWGTPIFDERGNVVYAIATFQLQVYKQKIVSNYQVYDQEVRVVASGDDAVPVIVRDISEQRNAPLRERKKQKSH